MQSYENERVIQQGEDWNLDIKLSQSVEEYIPYVISSERENPHFVLTVASTKFEKNHRYVESWWQEIPDTQPRFYETTPFYVGNFTYEPTCFKDLRLNNSDIRLDPPMYRLYQYTVNNGEIKYCYRKDEFDVDQFGNGDGNLGKDGFDVYVRFNILSHIPGLDGLQGGTANWNSQEYMYQITLVSGQLMEDTLISLITSTKYAKLNWRSDLPKKSDYTTTEKYIAALKEMLKNELIKKDIFYFVKEHIPDFFQKDIDWNSKLGQIWSPIPILKPTRLRVDSNLRVLI